MKVLIPLILVALRISAQDVVIGDSCTVVRTGERGTCRFVSQCKSVIEDLRYRRGRPTKCGYIDRIQVVCCPEDLLNTTTTTTLKPTLTKQENRRSEMCREYGKAVYAISYITQLTLEPARVEKIDKCGHSAVELIVDGIAAKSREFPHMALIGFGESSDIKYGCGGSLVSETHILTAGHCLYSQEYGQAKYVRLGELNLNSTDDDASPEDYQIEEFIRHPNYTTISHYNDIALLKLDRKVIFSPYIRPICLPMTEEIEQKKAIATGFGSIGFGEALNNILLKVTLELFPNEECVTKFKPNRKLKEGLQRSTQICAGSRHSSGDTCQGDSGGPLQIYNDDVYCTYTIIGVTSFGKSCGLSGVPAVYTRVYPYLPWIESIIWS